jgi:hypothetical protein
MQVIGGAVGTFHHNTSDHQFIDPVSDVG